jgi:hypothetical protein
MEKFSTSAPIEVPSEVKAALDAFVEDDGLEYADNQRYGLTSDLTSMALFEEARSRGCCGSFETTVTDLQGREWMVGCNYGH